MRARLNRLKMALFGLPVLVLPVLVLFAGMPFCATCGGHDEVVTEAVLRCPRAVALLGDDAHPARLGMACGNTEVSGGAGNASWHLPYTGSRGRGTVSFFAEKHGGEWQLLGAELEIGDETIDIVNCGGPPSSRPSAKPSGKIVQTNADAVTGKFDGKVIRSNHPTILTGSTCSGTMKRERGATTARVTVSCKGEVGEAGGVAPAGELALYDGDGTFSMDVGDSSRRDDDRSEIEDAKTSDQDKTPGCRLSSAGNSGTLTVWDTSPAAYEIVVEL